MRPVHHRDGTFRTVTTGDQTHTLRPPKVNKNTRQGVLRARKVAACR
ncbi:hypothetical protein SRIMM317S_00384 [Streptomyces rimosus subsp. rimosus]